MNTKADFVKSFAPVIVYCRLGTRHSRDQSGIDRERIQVK
jgi:hypothetical protein